MVVTVVAQSRPIQGQATSFSFFLRTCNDNGCQAIRKPAVETTVDQMFRLFLL